MQTHPPLSITYKEGNSSMFHHIYNNLSIPQSEEDQIIAGNFIPKGYVNGSSMCKAGGKLVGGYLRTKATQSRIAHLSSVMQICITELVIVIQGGDPEYQGTWLHPMIGLDCAQWVSDEMWYWAQSTLNIVLSPDFDPNSPEFQSARQNAQSLWNTLRMASKGAFYQLGDTIKAYLESGEATEDEHRWLYPNCQNTINRGLFGKDAKTIREELGIKKSELNRDHYNSEALRRLDHIQAVAARFASQGQHPLEAIYSALSLFGYTVIDYRNN